MRHQHRFAMTRHYPGSAQSQRTPSTQRTFAMAAPTLRLPDGQSLGAALASWESREERAFGEKPQRRSGRRVPAAERRWLDAAAKPTAAKALVAVDADADLDTARLLSGRRRRRYLNDCLLRELGGPLKAADIAELYQPVPFGFERTTVLEQLSASSRLLEDFLELREHSAPQPATPQTQTMSSSAAWARVGRRGRVALRRGAVGSPSLLVEVEQALRAFEAASGADTASLMVPGDSFARLITHALCAYLGLASASSTDEQGNRCTLVRRRRGAQAASPALPPCSTFLVVQ